MQALDSIQIIVKTDSSSETEASQLMANADIGTDKPSETGRFSDFLRQQVRTERQNRSAEKTISADKGQKLSEQASGKNLPDSLAAYDTNDKEDATASNVLLKLLSLFQQGGGDMTHQSEAGKILYQTFNENAPSLSANNASSDIQNSQIVADFDPLQVNFEELSRTDLLVQRNRATTTGMFGYEVGQAVWDPSLAGTAENTQADELSALDKELLTQLQQWLSALSAPDKHAAHAGVDSNLFLSGGMKQAANWLAELSHEQKLQLQQWIQAVKAADKGNAVSLTRTYSNGPVKGQSVNQESLNLFQFHPSQERASATTTQFFTGNNVEQSFKEMVHESFVTRKQFHQNLQKLTAESGLSQAAQQLSQNQSGEAKTGVTSTGVSSSLNQMAQWSINTPVSDRNWSSAFNQHLAVMAKDGGGRALIRLNPAHLGPVEASIKISQDAASIQVNASHVMTRDALEAAIPRLKEMLQEQGFSQVNVDISDKNFSPQQGKNHKDTASANQYAGVDGEEDGMVQSTIPVGNQTVLNGVVDYYT